MIFNKSIFFYLYLAIFVAYVPLRTQTPMPQKKETWITIFVHGIMSIKPHVNLDNFLRFMRDDVENTIYSKSVEYMRQDPIFYKNQAMQGIGLIPIDPNHFGKGQACSGLASLLNDTLTMSYGPHLDNHYYSFGWTGLLSPSRRYNDAMELYEALEKEIVKFRAKGINPKIRLIGYSHGGNVVLNLGAVRQKEAVRKDIVIDETILLGMPVQNETDYLVNDPLFKKIYHVFSTGDRVQKLDFFSYQRFFSQRVFKERNGFKLPKKLVQIQLKLTRHTSSSRNDKKKVALSYNFNNPLVVSGKSHLLRDSSPGHAELWFFGWTPVHYRKTFALNPLPAVVIFPCLLKTIQEIEHLLTPTNPVIVDMRPEHGITLIKNVKNYKFYKAVDFLPQDVFKQLQEKAMSYCPDNFTQEAYDQAIVSAFEKSREFHREHWSVKSKRKKRRLERVAHQEKASIELYDFDII